MLRNRPSRVSLGMADVNQTKQRLKLKQASHPLVAQTDWAYIHHQQQHKTRPQPQPHYNLGEGAQRSRDASFVQVDSNRHVPRVAIYESTDSAEDSDSDEPASPSVESVARLVHIAEVSPTITQVSGYNPPALVNIPPERRPFQEEPRPGANHGHRHHLSNPVPHSGSRYDHGFEPNLVPHGRLLSGNVFYSDSDDEFDERDVKTWSQPSPRSPSHMDNCDIKGREGNLASQPQRSLGMVARIVDVETDYRIGTTKLISTSPSTQCGSLNPIVNTSVTDSSPPGDLPSLPPTTPGHQLVRATRHQYTPGSGLRSQAMRFYDDEQPVSMQSQTPADLRRRFNTPVSPEMLITCQTARTHARMSAMEYSRLGPPRDPHRNTYPSFQQASPQPHTTSSQPSSPHSLNLDLRTAAAITAVQRRRTARGMSNENVIDPSMNGMEAERDAFLRRIEADGTTTMDNTPPREGRYERYIS
ncbi:hypothetical protein E4T44_04420 [Aureobasidium sp. EXF-8845]|nr:hypothetical protein E4T44_04420 [Aureobasidium sp. EXF-8845]